MRRAKAKKKPPSKPKLPEPIRQARITELLRMRLDGAEDWDCREYVAGEEQKTEDSPWVILPGFKATTAAELQSYLDEVDRQIAESCKIDRQTLIDSHIAKRRNLFTKATLAGDNGVALSCLRDEARLLDIYPGEQGNKAKPAADCSTAIKTAHVMRMIVSGASEQDIKTEIADLWPTEAAEPLIVAAMKSISSSANFDPGIVAGYCFEATREIHRRMLEAKDHGGALKAVKQLAELSRYVPTDDDETEATEEDAEGLGSLREAQGAIGSGGKVEDAGGPGDRRDTAGEEPGA